MRSTLFNLICFTGVFAMTLMNKSLADAQPLIPAIESNFYYQIGGGDDVPLPAFYNTTTIPLNADSNVGLGFDCGVFNPVASIRNSLNQIKDSALNVEQQVLSSATGAITEFPLYELSRADPNLYNLITNAMAGAKQDMAVSTKSCEVMQSEISSGGNPYAHWGQISLGNRWQQAIGTAELSGSSDINQVRQEVSEDAGKSGVPWVDPNNISRSRSAGGEHQAPIHVIHDTVMAGFQVIAENNAQHPNHPHSELTTIFPTAKEAADWVTNVMGDEVITTYDQGPKSSQPGVGLMTDIDSETQTLAPKLMKLVTGQEALTLKNLQAISPQGLSLSPEVIQTIQAQPRLVQTILVNKLAQNVAAMAVINKTQLAIQILHTGAKIPAIYSNEAAQKILHQAIIELQHEVQRILLFVHARETLLSNQLATIVQAGHQHTINNTSISMPSPNSAVMEQGAIGSK